MESQERICGLCLKECHNFKAVDGDMRDTLDVVLPKIDLAAIQELVACTHCTEMLIKCCEFKRSCFYTYNYIVSFVNNKDGIKLNLKDVYLSKNENDVPEDHVVCGFCMGHVKNVSAITFDVEDRDIILKKMVEQCLPELDLNFIEKPVICRPCHDSVENCFHFVRNCLMVEEKVKEYRETLDISSRGQIDLSSVLQFTERNIKIEINDNLFDIIKEEKPLCEERENADEMKIDNDGDIFKFEQKFCADSENAIEAESNNLDLVKMEETFCGENGTYLKKENLFEMEEQKYLVHEDIHIKTDQHDFSRFEDGTLQQSKPSDIMLEHKDPSKESIYKCDFCSYEAKYRNYLRSHLLKHKTPAEVEMYNCHSCSYQTKRKNNLMSHLLAIHGTERKTHLLVHKDPSVVTMYKCDSCPYQTEHKGFLKRHLLKHNNPSNIKIYKCDFCLYQVNNKCYLRRHLLTHKDPAEVEMYKCNFCSHQTKRKDDLIRHSLIHKSPSEVTMHKCNYCPYQTKRKSGLTDHLILHKDPSKVKMFNCTTCAFQTKYKVSLKAHLLQHKGPSEVPTYSCDSCSFQTKRKDYLKKHLLLHKDPSELTMYNCDICSYQTKYKRYLKRHLLIHESQ